LRPGLPLPFAVFAAFRPEDLFLAGGAPAAGGADASGEAASEAAGSDAFASAGSAFAFSTCPRTRRSARGAVFRPAGGEARRPALAGGAAVAFPADFGVDLRAPAFAVDSGAAVFLAAAFFGPAVFAFFDVDFFAAAFFGGAFFEAAFLGAVCLAAFFGGVFLEAAFFAVVLVDAAFLAAGFLAAVRPAVDFLPADFPRVDGFAGFPVAAAFPGAFLAAPFFEDFIADFRVDVFLAAAFPAVDGRADLRVVAFFADVLAAFFAAALRPAGLRAVVLLRDADFAVLAAAPRLAAAAFPVREDFLSLALRPDPLLADRFVAAGRLRPSDFFATVLFFAVAFFAAALRSVECSAPRLLPDLTDARPAAVFPVDRFFAALVAAARPAFAFRVLLAFFAFGLALGAMVTSWA